MTSVFNTNVSLLHNHDLFESLIVKKRIKVNGEAKGWPPLCLRHPELGLENSTLFGKRWLCVRNTCPNKRSFSCWTRCTTEQRGFICIDFKLRSHNKRPNRLRWIRSCGYRNVCDSILTRASGRDGPSEREGETVQVVRARIYWPEGLGNLAVSQPSCFLRMAWQLGTERVLQLNNPGISTAPI
ncbi:hypothetical protein CSKR_100233 [Clonorchis sinensis]|uniref:Uncharacterized protein n=1 Tax=Clonorchis sinensis TaxID=79923 RepID=A0A419PDY2_CLOSI|nr:hypothetical protein CSKR_100233 [Clonorchis sinensis]